MVFNHVINNKKENPFPEIIYFFIFFGIFCCLISNFTTQQIRFEIILSYLFVFVLACAKHCLFKILIFNENTNSNYESKDIKNKISFLFKIIKWLSPDFAFAQISKPVDSNLRKNYIQFANRINLIISIALLILLFNLDEVNSAFVVSLFAIYTISRSFEIIFSFGKDVLYSTEARKKSKLDKYDRLSLAISSLFEIIILNAVFYSIGTNNLCNIQIINSFFRSFGISTFTKDGLFSDTNSDEILINFMIVLQIFTTLTLTLLAIASYLGNNPNKNTTFSIKTKNCHYKRMYVKSPLLTLATFNKKEKREKND